MQELAAMRQLAAFPIPYVYNHVTFGWSETLHIVAVKLVTCYSPSLHCQVENKKKSSGLFPRYSVLEESV